MERDENVPIGTYSIIISTHTLTWSVTQKTAEVRRTKPISTHTLTWSVTFQPNHLYPAYWYFNSHAHVERDSASAVSLYILMNFNSHAHVERDPVTIGAIRTNPISTHTLTWSVTTPFLDFVGRFSISTHTLTWSVTQIDETKTRYILFQLTRSRGA